MGGHEQSGRASSPVSRQGGADWLGVANAGPLEITGGDVGMGNAQLGAGRTDARYQSARRHHSFSGVAQSAGRWSAAPLTRRRAVGNLCAAVDVRVCAIQSAHLFLRLYRRTRGFFCAFCDAHHTQLGHPCVNLYAGVVGGSWRRCGRRRHVDAGGKKSLQAVFFRQCFAGCFAGNAGG